MSITGISSIFQALNSSYMQSRLQNFQKEFRQLGQDLQSGDLSQAQTDFATLQSSAPSTNALSSTQSSSPLAIASQQLSQDLQSGNLQAAQQDYATIQQDFQQQAGAAGVSGHHHHHHHHAESSQNASNSQNPLAQLFSELGQDLQSGNLSAAKTAYSSLQQEFQQLGMSASSSTSSTTPSSSINIAV
jgi:outer membrane protein assembly factor BamD (BamD/ComL family)